MLRDFLIESWRIEGLPPEYVTPEIEGATRSFLDLPDITRADLENLAKVYAGDLGRLRSATGMDVRVGSYIPPRGGPEIISRLDDFLGRLNRSTYFSPWHLHIEYESLHPFLDGNGRTGRTLWAWHMIQIGRSPYSLPFLHRFYYETLAHVGR